MVDAHEIRLVSGYVANRKPKSARTLRGSGQAVGGRYNGLTLVRSLLQAKKGKAILAARLR
jgi:hypothetical protein